jgi:beta-lactamase class D
MDLNAEKLIDRKGLIIQKNTLKQLINTLEYKSQALEEANALITSNFRSSEALRISAEAQITLLNASLANQTQITINNKRKARRNGLLLFGGGVAVGVTTLVLLIK